MEIELPSTGCNISQTAGYIDNYTGTTRTRYLINENKLTRVYQTTYSGNPTQYYTCLKTGDIIYKPEYSVILPTLAFGIISFITIILYKIIVGRILK